MKYFIYCVITTLLTSFCSANSYADNICKTKNICEKGYCECVIFPVSAYDRYFYFSFDGIQKNHLYQCEFSDSLDHSHVVPGGTELPFGVTAQYSETNAHSFISINTYAMSDETGRLVIKLFSAGISLPNKVTLTCQMTG